MACFFIKKYMYLARADDFVNLSDVVFFKNVYI